MYYGVGKGVKLTFCQLTYIQLTKIFMKTFNVGTGFSDKQRRKPPKVGSIITYRFQELTMDGVPRYAAAMWS